MRAPVLMLARGLALMEPSGILKLRLMLVAVGKTVAPTGTWQR
jgi:hypothetical protein